MKYVSAEWKRTILQALEDNASIHDHMRQSLRHFTAKEVLQFKQVHPSYALTPRGLSNMFQRASQKAAQSFWDKCDLSDIDGPKDHRHRITEAAFLAFAERETDIALRAARMSKPKLVDEVVEMGVMALNDHVTRSFPEKEIKLGIARGKERLLAAVKSGNLMNDLPSYTMNEIYQPGIRVY